MQLKAAVSAYANELETYRQNYQQLEKRNHELESKNNKLETAIAKYEQQIKELSFKYLTAQEKLEILLYQRYMRSAEKVLADDKQQLLFTAEAEAAETTVEEEVEVKSHKRRKSGRKPLDPKLPRVEKIIDISEEEKNCACGAKLTKIGEETSEKLNIIPQQIYVEKTIRLKYACRCCEGTEDEEKPAVRIAPVEPSIIPKSITSPSLLSTIFTQKFERHLPYYRQEQMFSQIGAEISRQDMSNWQQHVYNKLRPLFELLKKKVKKGPVLQMDETTVQVIGEMERRDTDKSYMWLARGGPEKQKVIWYEYHPTRAAYNAKEFLQGYSGYLQTDGYEGYDCAVKDRPDIIHVGCFAHARRKFFEASKVNSCQKHKGNLSAEEGIKHIRKLYIIEDELRSQNLSEQEFLEQRKTRAAPVLEKFKAWLLKRKDEIPPTLLLGKAINYTLNEWGKLIAYLESPHLTPDNNACENAIRPFVLGRKNWLFSQSPQGAESSCGMFTLIETAKQNGLVPFNYLMALFEKVPYAVSTDDWEKLLPWRIFTA